MSLIDKLAWLEVKDKKILTARSKGKTKFYIPGGKREAGESDQEALIREIQEELTVDLKPETLKFHGKFSAQAHGKPDGTLVQMTCYWADYSGQLQEAAEIEEMAWLTYEEWEKTSYVDKLIFDDLKAKGIL